MQNLTPGVISTNPPTHGWLPQALDAVSNIATSGTRTRASNPAQDGVLLAARADQPLPRFGERPGGHPQAVQRPQQICDPATIAPAPANTLFGSINSIVGTEQRRISVGGKLSW